LPATGATVDAGAGNDYINATGSGADTVLFAKGDGQDRLDNTGSGYQRNDTLELSDILPSEILLTHSGNELIVSLPSTSDTFTALWQFYNGGTSIYGINAIEFSDGTTWDRATIASNAWVRGTSGNDSITMPTTGVTIDGGTGDDTLTVSAAGSDQIVFAKGDGHDTLHNSGTGYDRNDTLVLTDINPWDVQFSRSGYAMTMSVPSTGDSFKVDYQFWTDGLQGLSQVQFANGTVWDRSNLSDAVSTFTWAGSSGNPTLTGNDYGANVFQFGDGTETAVGGGRSNIYDVSTSTGQANIELSSVTGSKNEIDFSTGITDEKLWFEQTGDDLKIDLLGGSTSVTVDGWFSGASSQLQEITAGGLKIDSQISQLVQAMATYSAGQNGFDPATVTAVPQDAGLQASMAAAWHA
jgi:hypothetical protein